MKRGRPSSGRPLHHMMLVSGDYSLGWPLFDASISFKIPSKL